jgi:putative NIF3 family GTP cyclohydrolase 1 type 2
MSQDRLSRREFGLFAAAAAAAQPAGLTAQQVVERIQKNVGVPWRSATIDTFKAGNPETVVKGIATTFMTTFEVLQRASAAGKNLIITHEPTFYSHTDVVTQLTEDPVYQRKREFIEKNQLVVWRFHDHWHMRKPDPVTTGLIQDLGWTKYLSEKDPRMCVLPELTLGQLALQMQKSMKSRTMRVVGDPKTKVSRVVLYPGASNPMFAVKLNPESEVFVGGESTEWEGGAYARDVITAGLRKGVIFLGHEVSEEPGMRVCADWLKTFIPEIPVEWITAGEPFWRPAA